MLRSGPDLEEHGITHVVALSDCPGVRRFHFPGDVPFVTCSYQSL